MGHRQTDRSVSLESENGRCRTKTGKGVGGITHAGDTDIGNAADNRTCSTSSVPRMCNVRQLNTITDKQMLLDAT